MGQIPFTYFLTYRGCVFLSTVHPDRKQTGHIKWGYNTEPNTRVAFSPQKGVVRCDHEQYALGAVGNGC